MPTAASPPQFGRRSIRFSILWPESQQGRGRLSEVKHAWKGVGGGHGWWWTLVRQATGEWRGVVHERWRHERYGIDRALHAVNRPGNLYVHPAALRVEHRDRAETPGKYRDALERAALDPASTPWALGALAEELRRVNDRRVVELLGRAISERWDLVDGGEPWSAHHAAGLAEMARALWRLGNVENAERYRAAWDVYSREMTAALGLAAEFLRDLCDPEVVAAWSATPAEDAPLLLEAPTLVQPKVGRNAPCPCGSGRKAKKCCQNGGRFPASIS